MQIPTSIIFDIASTTTKTVASLLPIMAVYISIPLAFYFINKVKSMFPKK